jgi:hypothetical protein
LELGRELTDRPIEVRLDAGELIDFLTPFPLMFLEPLEAMTIP